MEWYLKAMRSWTDFDGRARRTEYWMFVLFYFVPMLFLSFAEPFLGTLSSILLFVIIVVHFIPGLAVAIRRLHDSGNSGWWLLIGLLPGIGFIVLLIFYCMDSSPGMNQYGPNPKEHQEFSEVLDDFV